MQRGQGLSRGRHGEPDELRPQLGPPSLWIPLSPDDIGVVYLQREDRLPTIFIRVAGTQFSVIAPQPDRVGRRNIKN